MQKTNFKEWERNNLRKWFFKGVDSLRENPKLSNVELELIFDDEFKKQK